MNVRRMPSAPPNSPASKTTLSRGDACSAWDASVVVQSSWAKTKAAKSTSWESSTSRSRVERPGLNVVVQGSTSATSSSPSVIAWTSGACLPDEPRKMRGLITRVSLTSPAPPPSPEPIRSPQGKSSRSCGGRLLEPELAPESGVGAADQAEVLAQLPHLAERGDRLDMVARV